MGHLNKLEGISFDKKVTRQFKDTCIFNVWDGHGGKADEAFTTCLPQTATVFSRQCGT